MHLPQSVYWRVHYKVLTAAEVAAVVSTDPPVAVLVVLAAVAVIVPAPCTVFSSVRTPAASPVHF